MTRTRMRAGLAGMMGLLGLTAAGEALALPARIILLRHGEKHDAYQLCAVGEERAQALAAQYLGRAAATSLFAGAAPPRAFFAITLHTLETITPSAKSWGLPVITFAALPDASGDIPLDLLNAQTRQMARDLLTDPAWNGATVVVTWEHDHIAKTAPSASKADATEAKPGQDKDGPKSPQAAAAHVAAADARPEQSHTLYDLFDLADFADALKNWPGENYDYFWIIDFDPTTGKASSFKQVKQTYNGAFAGLPQNDWGQSNGLTAASGCQL